MAKKITRITEEQLRNIIINTANRILKEDVLGNDWREREEEDDFVLNNYEPFEDQKEEYNEHDWGIKGERPNDQSVYV